MRLKTNGKQFLGPGNDDRKIMKILVKLFLSSFAFSVSVLPAFGYTTGIYIVPKAPKEYIEAARRGERLEKPITGFVVNNRVNVESLRLLAKELLSANSDLREKIVEILEDIGLQADSPSQLKFRIIRDRSVIKVLSNEALSKDDAASSSAINILRTRCRPTDLAVNGSSYVSSLRESPSPALLLLIAKAKIYQAKELVDVLADSPGWQDDEEKEVVRIAQAALGNKKIEEEFIAAAYEAKMHAPPAKPSKFFDMTGVKDGQRLANQIELLGFIGTRRSLVVACSFLRTPLKTYVTNHLETSVRYDVLNALLYNFPDEKVLFGPKTVEEFFESELFCTKNLGAVFDGPTPDLPPDRLYPSM